MPDSLIECPKCGQKIPLTSAIEGPIAERLRKEFDTERAAVARQAKEKAEANLAAELGDLRGQLSEQSKKLETAQAAEIALRKERRDLEQQKEALGLEVSRRVDEECQKIKRDTQKTMEEEYRRKAAEKDQQMAALAQEVAAAQRRAETLAAKEKDIAGEIAKLAEARRSMEQEIADKLQAERNKILAEAAKQAKDAQAAEMVDLQARLKEKDEKLAAAQKLELDLRKQRAELDDQKRELELRAARTIDDERARIRAETLKAADETHRLKEKEAEMQLASMRRQIDELKQKAEQTSQQLQGEVLELELEATLRTAFPHDEILAVAKGVHGGDVVHRVMTSQSQHCGTILWELKRTKNWSDGWIDKLKMDQRAAKADLAVIVTIAMPRDLTHMGNLDGVWIASRECMMGMVLALRDGLLRMAEAKRAAEGKHEKMEVLYAYFSGHEFKQRVEAIKEAFVTMREELEAEKRAMTKIWAKREKQLERVMLSTTGMHGDLAGIIGAALPEIAAFELKALAEGE